MSLAVWMGGCAVELDCARRADGGCEQVAVDGEPAASGLGDLGRQFLGRRRAKPATPDPPPPDRTIYAALCDAFKRKLVLDVMSGTSAGGVNGALLAAAIRGRRRLHPDFIRDRWLELGDFATLLHPASQASPRALMRGNKFHRDLERTFEDLLAEQDAADPRVLLSAEPAVDSADHPEVKLDVTTTDVVGDPQILTDTWGNRLRAREYRTLLRFRHDEDFTAGLLAQAARSSASFPGAFEPWQTSLDAARLGGFRERRWVVDGGLLDNAPIRAVLDLIPWQPAHRQVRRIVCYVDPDPAQALVKSPPEAGPKLQSVLGYTVNLPRQAPLVDQLYAIDQATRRAGSNRLVEHQLLALEADALRETAISLLPTYRRRRRLSSLEELLGDPNRAARAAEVLTAGDVELPWIPESFPPADGAWRWGVRGAQRVLHLLIDLIRLALPDLPFAERTPLLDARSTIDRLLGELENVRQGVLARSGPRGLVEDLLTGSQPGAVMAALAAEMAGDNDVVMTCLQAGIGAAFTVAAALVERHGPEIGEALFGPDWQSTAALDPERVNGFLHRALAIEVIRRSFSAEEDIESGQPLLFAQLTPSSPSPVFATNPFDQTGPADPRSKLTGIELGHFAAFYRSSWRANDFMWGRLDAAARIVEMLVDNVRAAELERLSEAEPPWGILGAAILPADATADQRWLVQEALAAAGGLVSAPGEQPLGADDLREPLEDALQADLRDRGRLTRVVCTRAAQLEILRHELAILDAQSRGDAGLGSAAKPLDLPLEDDLRPAIEELRGGGSLPARLGLDRSEVGSALALRTVVHALLVTPATVHTASRLIGRILFPLRALLLPIAGVVSRVPAYRLAAVLAFWAAASYLTVRMLTLNPEAAAKLSRVTSRETLAALLAAVAVVGVTAVPLVRARQSGWWSTAALRQLAWSAALLCSGGAVAAAYAYFGTGAGWDVMLLAPGARGVHDVVLGCLIALVAGPIAAGLLPVPGRARAVVDRWLSKPWAGWTSLAALTIALVLVGISSVWSLWTLRDGFWPTLSAALAAVGAPIAAGAYVFLHSRVRR